MVKWRFDETLFARFALALIRLHGAAIYKCASASSHSRYNVSPPAIGSRFCASCDFGSANGDTRRAHFTAKRGP